MYIFIKIKSLSSPTYVPFPSGQAIFHPKFVRILKQLVCTYKYAASHQQHSSTSGNIRSKGQKSTASSSLFNRFLPLVAQLWMMYIYYMCARVRRTARDHTRNDREPVDGWTEVSSPARCPFNARRSLLSPRLSLTCGIQFFFACFFSSIFTLQKCGDS